MAVSKTFYIDTTKSLDILLISHEIRRVVNESRPEIGTATVMIPFPGAAVAVFDKDVNREALVKELTPYVKNHLIQCLLPKSVVVPVEKGKMVIDPWQDVFLIDFDNTGRRRELRVCVFSESASTSASGNLAGKPGAAPAPSAGAPMPGP